MRVERIVTLVDHKTVSIYPLSTMSQRKPPCILYNQLMLTTRPYAREVLAIDRQWLEELAPRWYARGG